MDHSDLWQRRSEIEAGVPNQVGSLTFEVKTGTVYVIQTQVRSSKVLVQ